MIFGSATRAAILAKTGATLMAGLRVTLTESNQILKADDTTPEEWVVEVDWKYEPHLSDPNLRRFVIRQLSERHHDRQEWMQDVHTALAKAKHPISKDGLELLAASWYRHGVTVEAAVDCVIGRTSPERPCVKCGAPTIMLSIGKCDRCWDLEKRLRDKERVACLITPDTVARANEVQYGVLSEIPTHAVLGELSRRMVDMSAKEISMIRADFDDLFRVGFEVMRGESNESN